MGWGPIYKKLECIPDDLQIRYTFRLNLCKLFFFCAELLICYGTDMDRLSKYSEELDEMFDINQVHESGLVVREEECTINFTIDEVKRFLFVYI